LILIEDTIDALREIKSDAYLHFHPDVKIETSNKSIQINSMLEITFLGATNFRIIEYDYCSSFNHTKRAQCVKVSFFKSLKTFIKIYQ